jgi:hypothetical protein
LVGFGVLVGAVVFVGKGTGEFVGVTGTRVLVGGFVAVKVRVGTCVAVDDGTGVAAMMLVGSGLVFGREVSVARMIILVRVFVGKGVTVGEGVALGPVTGITAFGMAVSEGWGVSIKRDSGCSVGVKNSLANAS